MAITPQHQKGEPDEKDLEKAYNRARSIGLFLVEKYAREVLRDHDWLDEFVMAMGVSNFTVHEHDFGVSISEATGETGSELQTLLDNWDDVLKLTGEPMRFTATGPVRREW